MARPEGTYDPVDPVVDADDDEADDDADDDDEPEPIVDARVIPRPEAGARPPPGADGGQVMREDGNVEPPPVDDPRAALAGRYLMRMDMYSTIQTTGTPTIRLKNRVSNLFLLDLAFDGEGLRGTETLCDQVYDHDCVSGCRSWATKVDSSVRQAYFNGGRSIEREYTYADGTLKAMQRSFALGYDEGEGQGSVPTSETDQRVWNMGRGPGIYTEFEAQPNIGGAITCQVSTVQRFTTEFSGMVSGDPLSLDGKQFDLKVTTVGGVIGNPTGSSRTQCTRSRFEEQQTPQDEKFVVRFKAFDGDACPNFDSAFPAMPRFM